MAQSIYVGGLVGFLLISGLCHLLMPMQPGLWLSRAGVVRVIGGLLVVLAAPCLWWRGWYFWALFVGLAVAGMWRLCFPRHSIHAQGVELVAQGAWLVAGGGSGCGVDAAAGTVRVAGMLTVRAGFRMVGGGLWRVCG